MAEKIDIYDANLKLLGTCDRKEAHLKGAWHRTFHCWYFRTIPTSAILFQKRSPQMKNFPNALDVSAAGHLEAGENISDGLREISEELGITVDMTQLKYAGERVEVADQTNGQKNREYQSVFFAQMNANLLDLKPDPVEVCGLYWLDIESGFSLFSERVVSVKLEGIELHSDGIFLPKSYDVRLDDFLPRIQKYYLTSLIMVERIIDGKLDVAIS
jgi:isopentenyldiphosphate isomerase